MIVPNVLHQHLDDAVALVEARFRSRHGAHVSLRWLHRADLRLRAHMDGLELAGEAVSRSCDEALENPSQGLLFVLAGRALLNRDEIALSRLMALAQALPETSTGLLNAFGWVERSFLQGVVAGFLTHDSSFHRLVGLAACAMQRVDPGRLAGLLKDADPMVRARAFRTVGELGLADMLAPCVAVARSDEDAEVQFWAAWSSVLLGNRGAALEVLATHGFQPAPHRERAFRLALQAMTTKVAHAALQRLAEDETTRRWVIQGSGIAGDPAYVPWLIKQMDNLQLARLAAEAFTCLSGLDLGAEALDRPAPEGFEAGPTDDPDNPDVDTDPDDGLPWPDVQKIQAWWEANAQRFQPGTRYFMGAPVTHEHCIEVLKNGYQRQRFLSAHYLCLLDPGTALFNTSAPAWRQQTLLDQMV